MELKMDDALLKDMIEQIGYDFTKELLPTVVEDTHTLVSAIKPILLRNIEAEMEASDVKELIDELAKIILRGAISDIAESTMRAVIGDVDPEAMKTDDEWTGIHEMEEVEAILDRHKNNVVLYVFYMCLPNFVGPDIGYEFHSKSFKDIDISNLN